MQALLALERFGKCMLRLGFLGFGRWGRKLANAFAETRGLAVVSGADPCGAARAAFAARFPRSLTYSSMEQLIGGASVDAIVVASPPDTHSDLTLQALRAGKHAFVEKPLAMSGSDVDAIEAIAVSKGLRVMVGHVLLYHPLVRVLRSMIACGELGSVRAMEFERLGPATRYRPEGPWWTLAPHDVSLARYFSGRNPTSVSLASQGSGLVARLGYPGDLRAKITVSSTSPAQRRRTLVVGDDATAIFDEAGVGSLELVRRRGSRAGAPISPDVVRRPDPLMDEVRAFRDWILGGPNPLSDVHEGAAVVRTLELGFRSLNDPTKDGAELWNGPELLQGASERV